MIEWIPVSSSRVSAIAYDSATETIYVRFHDGMEWAYQGCPPSIWAEFSSPTTSKGRFINDVLNFRPNGRHA